MANTLTTTTSYRGLRVLVVGAQLSPHSGTSKVTLEVIHGLAEIGCEVSSHFFGVSSDAGLLGESWAHLPPPSLRARITGTISRAVQLPLIRTVWSQGFTSEDSVDLLGALTDTEFYRKVRAAQVIVFMNFWSAVPLFRVDPRLRTRTVVYFHERPGFREIPPVLRQAVRGLVKRAAHRCNVVISASDRIRAGVRVELGIESRVLDHGIRSKAVSESKEPYVLLDTRWTDARDPFLGLALAESLPEFRFVMAGFFPSPPTLGRMRSEIERRGLRDRFVIVSNLSEDRLNGLYARARFYVRWSARGGEDGPSLGVFQAIGNLCPPVVDRELGAMEFLVGNGLAELVADRDPQALAKRLRSLIATEAGYDSLLNQLERVRKEHSWSEYCRRLVEIAMNES